MKTAVELTAVEQLVYYLPNSINVQFKEQIEEALEMERRQAIKSQIEILKFIGNCGKNANLYGILKIEILQLEKNL